jgi:hypothetical protein
VKIRAADAAMGDADLDVLLAQRPRGVGEGLQLALDFVGGKGPELFFGVVTAVCAHDVKELVWVEL